MKYFVFLFVFLLSFGSYSQVPLKGMVELSQSSDILFTTSQSNLKLGIQKGFKTRGEFSIFANYSYGGVRAYDKPSFYEISYHLIGLGSRIKVRPTDKMVNFGLNINAYTEVYSASKDARLVVSKYDSKTKIMMFRAAYNPYAYHDGEFVYALQYDSFYYVSTPLVARILFESNIKLSDDFILNIGVGGMYRVVRFSWNHWLGGQPEPQIPSGETHSFETTESSQIQTFKYIDLELGLTYSFPFKVILNIL